MMTSTCRAIQSFAFRQRATGWLLALALSGLSGGASDAAAQRSGQPTCQPSDLLQLHRIDAVALAPAGQDVIVDLQVPDSTHRRYVHALWRVSANGRYQPAVVP